MAAGVETPAGRLRCRSRLCPASLLRQEATPVGAEDKPEVSLSASCSLPFIRSIFVAGFFAHQLAVLLLFRALSVYNSVMIILV